MYRNGTPYFLHYIVEVASRHIGMGRYGALEAEHLADSLLHGCLAPKSERAMNVAMWPAHRNHPTPACRRFSGRGRVKLVGGKGLR